MRGGPAIASLVALRSDPASIPVATAAAITVATADLIVVTVPPDVPPVTTDQAPPQMTLSTQVAEAQSLGARSPTLSKQQAAKRSWDDARLTDNSHWVSKRVRVLSASHKGCEGVVTSVTKSGALKVHIDGTSDAYCPALLPKSLEIVTSTEIPQYDALFENRTTTDVTEITTVRCTVREQNDN